MIMGMIGDYRGRGADAIFYLRDRQRGAQAWLQAAGRRLEPGNKQHDEPYHRAVGPASSTRPIGSTKKTAYDMIGADPRLRGSLPGCAPSRPGCRPSRRRGRRTRAGPPQSRLADGDPLGPGRRFPEGLDAGTRLKVSPARRAASSTCARPALSPAIANDSSALSRSPASRKHRPCRSAPPRRTSLRRAARAARKNPVSIPVCPRHRPPRLFCRYDTTPGRRGGRCACAYSMCDSAASIRAAQAGSVPRSPRARR